MGHRDEFKPGDLAVRLAFSRGMSSTTGVFPHLEVTDQTSGSTIDIRLTAEQITEMLAGGTANVTADKVTGFKGLSRWGKYHKVTSRVVPGQSGDYDSKDHPETLPHVAAAIEEIEAEGFVCDKPRRTNAGDWAVFGRRYDDQPD
jgi:hypothetical protein